MQAFMLYMSGSGVQIFSMGTVFMLLSNPIKGVVGIQKGQHQPSCPTLQLWNPPLTCPLSYFQRLSRSDFLPTRKSRPPRSPRR